MSLEELLTRPDEDFQQAMEHVIAKNAEIKNHPFVDGNKRIGHAAMETFLVLNGYEIEASVDEQEQVILQVAPGEMGREAFTEWLRVHIVPGVRERRTD